MERRLSRAAEPLKVLQVEPLGTLPLRRGVYSPGVRHVCVGLSSHVDVEDAPDDDVGDLRRLLPPFVEIPQTSKGGAQIRGVLHLRRHGPVDSARRPDERRRREGVSCRAPLTPSPLRAERWSSLESVDFFLFRSCKTKPVAASSVLTGLCFAVCRVYFSVSCRLCAYTDRTAFSFHVYARSVPSKIHTGRDISKVRVPPPDGWVQIRWGPN